MQRGLDCFLWEIAHSKWARSVWGQAGPRCMGEILEGRTCGLPYKEGLRGLEGCRQALTQYRLSKEAPREFTALVSRAMELAFCYVFATATAAWAVIGKHFRCMTGCSGVRRLRGVGKAGPRWCQGSVRLTWKGLFFVQAAGIASHFLSGREETKAFRAKTIDRLFSLS